MAAKSRPQWAGTAAALWVFAGGCGPRVPDQEAARAAYASHRAKLDALDEELNEALLAFPYLGVQSDDLPCTPPREAAPEAIPGVGEVVADAHCTAQLIELLEARNEALRGFEDEVLPSLARRHGLLGLDVTYTMPGEPLRHSLGRAGSIYSSQREGTVCAEEGPSLDGRQLGWSLYPDPSRDRAERPGIEVMWTFPWANAQMRASTVILAE